MNNNLLAVSRKAASVSIAFGMAFILGLGVPSPSFASGYTPPPEAFEGVGGWAVIDPRTGIVYGVIVADWDETTWAQVKDSSDILTSGYMGCPSPCEFRFQTRATADGNVAGWHGTQTTIDDQGNAIQTNDGSVRFDEVSGHFVIGNQSSDGIKTKQTLVPSKTSRDSDGNGRSMNISSGIVDSQTSKEFSAGDQSATVEVNTSSVLNQRSKVTILLPGLGPDGTVIEYPASDGEQITRDLISILIAQGLTKTETLIDEQSGEQMSSDVLDESDSLVESILNIAQQIASFLGSLLGWSGPVS